jgi:protein ImuB
MRRIACIRWQNDDGKSPIDFRFQISNLKSQISNFRSQLSDFRLPIVECCRRFSPIVGLEPTDPQSVLLDITGLAHLFGGEQLLAEAMARECVALSPHVCVAVADTIGAAWALAWYCKMQNVKGKLQNDNLGILPFTFCILPFAFPLPLVVAPPGEAIFALHPLPTEALRLPEETARLLGELGLATVGQLEALPREELSSRFGPVLLRRLDQAFGRLDEPVLPCSFSPTFAAHWSAEHPIVRRETIEAALEHLIGRVAGTLDRRDCGALRLECSLEYDDCKLQSPFTPQSLRLSVGLFRPTAAAKHLLELVRLQLERTRIASPVAAIHVAATLTAPLEPRRQAALFDFGGDAAARRRLRHLAALVERLSSRLGPEAVVRVRLRPDAQPELSWQYDPLVGTNKGMSPFAPRKLRGFAKRQKGDRRILLEQPSGCCAQNAPVPFLPLPPRPLRLLGRPRLLPAISIAPQGPPRRFSFAGQQCQIARHWGPERIETGWWRGRPIGRDYFRVETTAGNHYWLFRRLRDGKWFLHGVFE